jgi:hypothetical protein
MQELEHLHRAGNDIVRAAVVEQLRMLQADDSRSVSAAATEVLDRIRPGVIPKPERSPAGTPTRAISTTPRPAVPTPVPREEPPAPPVAAPPVDAAPATVAAPPGEASVPVPEVAERRHPGAAGKLLLALLLVAGVLLTVSRFLVFEATNGYHAVNAGWPNGNFVIQVLLPLVVACGALLAAARRPAAPALAVGIAAGITLNLVAQLLMSLAVFLDPDVGYQPGPAWWLILVAAVVLGAGVVAVVALTSLRTPVHRRRDRWAVAGASLVVLSGVLWALAPPVTVDFGPWEFVQFAGLLLCLACLPVAVLRLNRDQRVLGLAAVTTTGVWLAAAGVEALIVMPSGFQAGALAATLVATLLQLAGAWVGQRRTSPADAAAG